MRRGELTVAEAAARAEVNPQTITALAAAGALKSRKAGYRRYLHAGSVAAYAARRNAGAAQLARAQLRLRAEVLAGMSAGRAAAAAMAHARFPSKEAP